jgi:hypothetical protein
VGCCRQNSRAFEISSTTLNEELSVLFEKGTLINDTLNFFFLPHQQSISLNLFMSFYFFSLHIIVKYKKKLPLKKWVIMPKIEHQFFRIYRYTLRHGIKKKVVEEEKVFKHEMLHIFYAAPYLFYFVIDENKFIYLLLQL